MVQNLNHKVIRFHKSKISHKIPLGTNHKLVDNILCNIGYHFLPKITFEL